VTSGERAVWASEFVRARAMGKTRLVALFMARAAVLDLQAARAEVRHPDDRAMLEDMLGVPR
jgi:hypothetical protein